MILCFSIIVFVSVSFKQQWWKIRCKYIPLRFCQESLLLSFLNRGSLKHRLLCILTPSAFCIVCVFVCVRCFRKQGKEGVISQLLLCIFPSTAFLCVVSVYVCVGRCVGVFMAPFLLTTSLHLPPSLPCSPSPSFLLNLSFHPVQTVCRCCPPLPLHHVCRNEIKP